MILSARTFSLSAVVVLAIAGCQSARIADNSPSLARAPEPTVLNVHQDAINAPSGVINAAGEADDLKNEVVAAANQVVGAAVTPDPLTLAGPHAVEDYVQYALAYNPLVQAKRRRVDAAAMRVPQAGSLKDPTVAVMGYPFYPNVPQTASGRMTADLTVSQEVPWFGKLSTQADAAAAETNMAWAELAATELEITEQVRLAYYDLYFVQKSIEITGQNRGLAEQISRIAESRYKTGQVSQQDLLRAELEVSNVDTELIRLNQELQSAQARLARLLHVAPQTAALALADLPTEQLPADMEQLYERAIALRPELQGQLAAVQRDRLNIDLARLGYYPDVTFAFGWGGMTTRRAIAPTADGIDNLSVGLMANIPLYVHRIDAGVHEAQSKAIASAHEYDNLRDRTGEEIRDILAQANSQRQLLELFRNEIIPKSRQTLDVAMRAYESNQVDFLQLIDNWRQLLQYQIMQQRLESQLRQSLARLERLVGGVMPDIRSDSVVTPVSATSSSQSHLQSNSGRQMRSASPPS